MPATLDLEAAGDFEWAKRYDRQQVPVAKRDPRLDVFDVSELEIINELLDRYRRHTGKQLVDIAHEHPAWKAREQGDKVPYWSVYMSKNPPTRDDVIWGETVVRELDEAR